MFDINFHFFLECGLAADMLTDTHIERDLDKQTDMQTDRRREREKGGWEVKRHER